MQKVLLQNCLLAGQLLLSHLLHRHSSLIYCVFCQSEMLKPLSPTLMSSGQPSSCLFPSTLRWISSRVSSRVGRGPFVSTAMSSSVEPKLLGKVLLRGRVWGPSSLSARCLASVGMETKRIKEMSRHGRLSKTSGWTHV